MAAEGPFVDEFEEIEEAPESVPIESLRRALAEGLLTDEVAGDLQALILSGLKASKSVFATCTHCHKRTHVELPDLATRISAARALIEEIEGKLAAAAPPKERTDLAWRKFEDLSDDELELLVYESYLDDPEWDGRDPRSGESIAEIARRVLAAHPFDAEAAKA